MGFTYTNSKCSSKFKIFFVFDEIQQLSKSINKPTTKCYIKNDMSDQVWIAFCEPAAHFRLIICIRFLVRLFRIMSSYCRRRCRTTKTLILTIQTLSVNRHLFMNSDTKCYQGQGLLNDLGSFDIDLQMTMTFNLFSNTLILVISCLC